MSDELQEQKNAIEFIAEQTRIPELFFKELVDALILPENISTFSSVSNITYVFLIGKLLNHEDIYKRVAGTFLNNGFVFVPSIDIYTPTIEDYGNIIYKESQPFSIERETVYTVDSNISRGQINLKLPQYEWDYIGLTGLDEQVFVSFSKLDDLNCIEQDILPLNPKNLELDNLGILSSIAPTKNNAMDAGYNDDPLEGGKKEDGASYEIRT